MPSSEAQIIKRKRKQKNRRIQQRAQYKAMHELLKIQLLGLEHVRFVIWDKLPVHVRQPRSHEASAAIPTRAVLSNIIAGQPARILDQDTVVFVRQGDEIVLGFVVLFEAEPIMRDHEIHIRVWHCNQIETKESY
jgi:hypothetical protein